MSGVRGLIREQLIITSGFAYLFIVVVQRSVVQHFHSKLGVEQVLYHHLVPLQVEVQVCMISGSKNSQTNSIQILHLSKLAILSSRNA